MVQFGVKTGIFTMMVVILAGNSPPGFNLSRVGVMVVLRTNPGKQCTLVLLHE